MTPTTTVRTRGTTTVAWVALALALVATVTAAALRRHDLANEPERRFNADADAYAAAVVDGLDGQADLLHDSSSLFAEHPVPSTQQAEGVANPVIPSTVPGLLGVGHVVAVGEEQIPAFLDQRAEITGRGSQVIQPAGQRDVYWLAAISIPESTLALPNIDNRAIPQNRDAMEQAQASGEVVTAMPVDVPLLDSPDSDAVSVFNMFLAVDPSQEPNALRGWASTTVLGSEFLNGVMPGFPHDVKAVAIKDGATAVVGERFEGVKPSGAADDVRPPGESPNDHFATTRNVLAHGLRWKLEFRSIAAPPAASWSEPILILLLGASLGFAVFAALYVLARGRARALAVADHATSSLGRVEERFRSAFEDAPIGIALVGSNHKLQRVNRALCSMLGRSEKTLVGSGLEAVAHADDVADLAGHLDALLRAEPVSFPFECRFVEAHGTPVTASISASRVAGDSDAPQPYFIMQIEDISDRKRAAARLAYQATHDALTDIPNRAAFVELLDETLIEPGNGIAVLFIDLDRFKVVNDSLGHSAGDEVLRIAARRIRTALRPGDQVARMGGDEFTVLARDIADADSAEALAHRIRETMTEPVAVASSSVSITPSIGIALSGDPSATAESLIRDADAAQYRSKSRGRSRIEFFDAEARSETRRVLEIEQDLSRALGADELVLHYQPEVDLETGAVTGVEALMRWHHPRRGMLQPAEFIDIAEESGLIVPLGTWAIMEACRQATRWDAEGVGSGLSMSVNLSARQFLLPDLPDIVSAAVRESGLPPERLCLEMTETALMDEGDATLASLEALRALGVQLSVDDFGTGYSSLAYLKRFPVDWLKVDQSFVDGLGTDAEDTAIVTAVISLAHALDLHVVAEGVETADQLANLRTLGCDIGQGTLFSAPMPASELRAFLRGRRVAPRPLPNLSSDSTL